MRNKTIIIEAVKSLSEYKHILGLIQDTNKFALHISKEHTLYQLNTDGRFTFSKLIEFKAISIPFPKEFLDSMDSIEIYIDMTAIEKALSDLIDRGVRSKELLIDNDFTVDATIFTNKMFVNIEEYLESKIAVKGFCFK